VGLIPWSPLARGFLAGNRNPESRGETIRAKTDDFAQKLYYRPSDFTVVDRLTEIATKRGVQNSQVALAWILAKPGVSAPIIGASKMAHLDQAIEALKIHLDESEMKTLEEPYEPHPVLGF
jgi:aryl-alcohol dehydrogenase (NADP+)